MEHPSKHVYACRPPRNEPLDDRTEQTARRVIGAIIEVHKTLGPGFLESVYEEALAIELERRGIPFSRQWTFSVEYQGRPVGQGRLDFLVDGCLIVELKAVDMLSALHTAQVLSYLKATRLRLALLINFNVPVVKVGIKRVVC